VTSRTLRVAGTMVSLSRDQFAYQAGDTGMVALEATATDGHGNVGTTTATLRVSEELDSQAPQVTLGIQPQNAQVGDLVAFTIGTSDAGGIDPERVWLLVDGQYLPVVDGRAEY